jgi:hypothetical protein
MKTAKLPLLLVRVEVVVGQLANGRLGRGPTRSDVGRRRLWLLGYDYFHSLADARA